MTTPQHYAEQVLLAAEQPLHPYDLFYVTKPDELPHFFEWLARQKVIGLDLETSGLDPLRGAMIATIQVGTPERVYVLDERCFTHDQLEPLWEVLRSRQVTKLGMNIGFECRFLFYHHGIKVRKVQDIQVAELILRAGLLPTKKGTGEDSEAGRIAYGSTSMAKLCLRYLGITIEKDDDIRLSFYSTPVAKHSRRQVMYAGLDCIYPFAVAKKQRAERDVRQLKNVLDVEFEVLPVLSESEIHGMGMDQPAWRELYQEAVTKRLEAQDELDKFFAKITGQGDFFGGGRPINPKSRKEFNYSAPDTVRWAVREYCQAIGWTHEVVTDRKRLLEIKKQHGDWWLAKRPDKHPSDVPDYVVPEDQFCILMDTETRTLKLARARKQLPADLVTWLLAYSKYNKRYTTYGIQFLNKHVNPQTGRVHTHFHQAIAATGRLSSEPNLQNIPTDRRYRACFVPRPGYKYVIADYSQIEPRLSAEVSQDANYIATFLEADDIYCRVAQAMTGEYPDKKTPEGKVLRQIFKIIVLALAYRMGAGKLRDELTLALEDEILAGRMDVPSFDWARSLWTRFLEVHQGIKAYQDRCSNQADPKNADAPRIFDLLAKEGVTWVTGPCGRKRFFASTALGTYTSGPNAPIQGSSATITKAAAAKVQEVIDAEGWDAFVVDLIHDEIVWEVREDQAEAFAPIAKNLMEWAGKLWVRTVPVIAEFPKGTNGVVDYWMKEAA